MSQTYPDSPRPESLPPEPVEVLAFDDRLRGARTDRERLLLLVEETRAIVGLQVETKNLIGQHAQADREAHAHLADGLMVAAQAMRELRDEVRANEARRQADAREAAEATGHLARELADLRRGQDDEARVRAHADSIHEERIEQVGQKTKAIEKKADALAVVKPWLVGGAKLGAQGGVTALALKLLDLLLG